MTIIQLCLLIPVLYFVLALVLLIFRSKLNLKTAALLCLFFSGIGLVISIGFLFSPPTNQVWRASWASMGSYALHFSLSIDKLSIAMLALVQLVGWLVQLFSVKYMGKDERVVLYYAYLMLFIFSMLGLVMSGNLLFMFIFWELVGFCSYLLIGFWYKKNTATSAALKAFILNRIGDAGFLIGIGITYATFGTLELNELLAHYTSAPEATLTTISLLLFVACIGKSAQFPLQVWLPDAMEGPTPASALIHAATMVAAGIFLLARISFIITPTAGLIIASVGALTSFFAAYTAIFQNDIKKVLAYSTVSQLGLMVMAMGAGATHAALFHLMTHAFFKAGLFLIAGAVIDHFHHEQDMQKMGGLFKAKPYLAIAYIICGGALAGLPLTSGYLSKDAFLLETFAWASDINQPFYLIIPIVGFITSVLTAYYVTRQFILIFWSPDALKDINWKSFDLYTLAILPLMVLSLGVSHSLHILNPEMAYFGKWFPLQPVHNHWIGYVLLTFIVIAMLVSYLTYTKNKMALLSKKMFSVLGQQHFYQNYFFTKIAAPAMVGQKHYDKENMPVIDRPGFIDYFRSLNFGPIDKLTKGLLKSENGLAKYLHIFDHSLVDGLILLAQQFILFLSKSADYLDRFFVDGIVKGVYGSVSGIGQKLKTIQGGKIQGYLMALLLLIVSILLILILF